jgi:hypothetical protein
MEQVQGVCWWTGGVAGARGGDDGWRIAAWSKRFCRETSMTRHAAKQQRPHQDRKWITAALSLFSDSLDSLYLPYTNNMIISLHPCFSRVPPMLSAGQHF